ncbi:NRAMP-like transporter smf-3 [Sporothrix epigloea]|uniref:NRAMP-like transporter smf-3 n=1 Tax=Sporothrix epigloea TaxID=1892477 RepID=A0ABP0E246_9PEZI
MNRPSRTDELPRSDGMNQSPNPLSNDLTTNEDLNGLANGRRLQRSVSPPIQHAGVAGQSSRGGMIMDNDTDLGAREKVVVEGPTTTRVGSGGTARRPSQTSALPVGSPNDDRSGRNDGNADHNGALDAGGRDGGAQNTGSVWKVVSSLKTFLQFVGPGFIVSVAYIDPGNYSTDIAAGASYRYKLLFVVLLSNCFAIYLQSLAIKLGSVSGRNLAAACRAFLPRWLNIFLYILAEVAIIATDIAEVIGTAIALNMLQPKIPLVAGCAISIADVLIVLVFCKPENGTRSGLRAFELVVVPLVLGVVVCFCIQLAMIDHSSTSIGEVFLGYVPSSALIQQQGLYQACGILGATVMPHSLYLGSGIVQARLREYDQKHGLLPAEMELNAQPRPTVEAVEDIESDDDDADNNDTNNDWNSRLANRTASLHRRLSVIKSKTGDDDLVQKYTYIPSLDAVRHCYKYSVVEISLSLFTLALFVNSAILIVAGASLYGNSVAIDADIFAIHDLLTTNLSRAAGTVFALALLFSGLSAGVVCTVAGQMVCEGALQWTIAPWLRRLLTRSISILPSIIIAGAVGRTGLDTALNATQVVLSVVLPFVTAPLLWFTTFDKYMTVQPGSARFALRSRYRKGDDVSRGGVTNADTQDQGQPDEEDADLDGSQTPFKMANSWPTAILGLAIWLFIAILNVANLVLLGMSN